MLLLNSAKKNSPCVRKGNKMISACILFVFASGYGVATKECRHDYGYHPPSEVVHVVGDNLSTPPHMVIITPPVSYVYRWSHPTYQVNRRYVDSQYLDLNPVIITSPTIVVRPRPRVRTRTYSYSPRRTVKRRIRKQRRHRRVQRNKSRRINRRIKRRRHRRIS